MRVVIVLVSGGFFLMPLIFLTTFSVHDTVGMLSEYMATFLCLRDTYNNSMTIHTNSCASIYRY